MKSLSYSGAGGIRTHQRIMCSRCILSANDGSVPVLMRKDGVNISPHKNIFFRVRLLLHWRDHKLYITVASRGLFRQLLAAEELDRSGNGL